MEGDRLSGSDARESASPPMPDPSPASASSAPRMGATTESIGPRKATRNIGQGAERKIYSY